MLTLGRAELGKNFLYRFKVVYHWMLQEIFTAKSLLGPLKMIRMASKSDQIKK